MASIKQYAAKSGPKGKLWRVQYQSPDGKGKQKRGFRTRDEAELWAAENLVDMAAGTWIDPQKAKTKISALWAPWIASKSGLQDSSLTKMESSWRVHVQPRWGNLPVSQVTKTAVQTWLGDHKDQAVTIRRAHGILAGIMDLAVEQKCVTTNYARGVSLPRKPEPEHVFLTHKQLISLVMECSRDQDLILLLGTTGVRWGEAGGIQPRDLIPERRRVQLRRAVRDTHRSLSIAPLKNHENRSIATSQVVMDRLVKLSEGMAPTDHIFTAPDGGLLGTLDKHSPFHMAVGRLVGKGVLPSRITPHDLRHVAAGLLVSGGANVKAVQRQLGHKSAAMTLDVYSALFDGDLDVVADAMDAALAVSAKFQPDGRILQAV